MMRIYEKGKQLGDSSSAWVRFEVELGSRDRFIDPLILVQSDQAFAEAYPFCAALLASYSEKTVEETEEKLVRITKVKQETVVEYLMNHAKRGYGALINLLSVYGMPDTEIVSRLRRAGAPRRVQSLLPC